MTRQPMTYGEAVKDTSTALGRMAAQSAAAAEDRIARARDIAAAEGITLEEALQRLWEQAAGRRINERGTG